jgi:CRISPR-associated endonuclease Csn1
MQSLESITNPIVKRSITQTLKMVNFAIQKYGKPYQINIELARDLTKSYEDRQKISKNMEKNYQSNQQLKKECFEITNYRVVFYVVIANHWKIWTTKEYIILVNP